MRAQRFSADPVAVLVFTLLYVSLEDRELAALLPAVLIHELGHLAAMRLLGLRLCALRLELTGLCIRYSGAPNRWERFLTAAAGPALGLIYAQLASCMGWELTAGLSLLLSLFNLLPVQPLDGWQMAAALCSGARSGRVLDTLGVLVSVAVLCLGIGLARQGSGFGLCTVGICLLISQIILRYYMGNHDILQA